MPAKNTVREYIEDGYYHVYNRGVEKRDIFCDETDYLVFLSFLKKYLTEPEKGFANEIQVSVYEDIELLAYCLMPNHFHLVLKQHRVDAITDFMKALLTRYAMYFNKKYNRVGSLFQGKFRAVAIYTDEYLLHLSRYVHLNPGQSDYQQYPYSSYQYYLSNRTAFWMKADFITGLIGGTEEYMSFMKDNINQDGLLVGLKIDNEDDV